MECNNSNIQIETVVSRIQDGSLNLQPEFQRGEVWSVAKKKKLIDTILRGWKIPPIHVVLSEDKMTEEVLDGQQRLAAIRDFCDGLFSVDGKIQPENQEIKSLDGLKFDELPAKVLIRFNRYDIPFITLTNFKPAEPAELFDRLNQPIKLTSAEQRNAYIGETRNQIKGLVRYFEKIGASKETIGFSNSRLAYDEIIAKFCYAIELGTLRQKIVASNISEKYRENIVFSDNTIEECAHVLNVFIDIVQSGSRDEYRLKMNKATIYSWFVFIKQNKELSTAEISKVMYLFEFIRDFLKGKLYVDSDFNAYMLHHYEDLKNRAVYLETMINIFNQKASMSSTDTLSIIYRDIILYVFSRFVYEDKADNIVRDFDHMAMRSVSNALEYVYDNYDWGDVF